MERGVAHIAFHYVPERFEILKKTIEYLKSWDVYLDIFIHSNVEGNIENWIWYKNLRHPFALTWLPMKTINTQLDSYDFFVYLEDDIGIPKSAFEYWKRYPVPNLAFLRKNTITGKFDDIESMQATLEDVPKLPFLYKGFWINTKEQMKKYSENFETNTLVGIIRNLEWSRERSALGNTVDYTNLIFSEPENSIVWHLLSLQK